MVRFSTRKDEIGGAVLVCAAIGWAILLMIWLFFGSGYQVVQPQAYNVTTHILLSNPVTALDASEVIEAQGYMSIVEQNRLLSKIAQ